MFADAMYVKIREISRDITKVLCITFGICLDEYREILGEKIADSELESYWSFMFDELKERGLSGVQRDISNVHR